MRDETQPQFLHMPGSIISTRRICESCQCIKYAPTPNNSVLPILCCRKYVKIFLHRSDHERLSFGFRSVKYAYLQDAKFLEESPKMRLLYWARLRHISIPSRGNLIQLTSESPH